MSFSVHTNVGAMTALQALNKSNAELGEVQSRINTGLKVNGAKDNASIFAIAQNQRADVSSLNAVGQSLSRATSIVDVAMAAAESISDLLVQMKEKVVAAKDPSIDQASRDALNADFLAIRDQIKSIILNAEFDGANILDNSLPNGIAFLADADAQNTITLISENLSVSGTNIVITNSTNLASQSAASSALVQLTSSITRVNAALARLGSSAKKLEAHNIFVGKLQDTLKAGIGNLVDADLAVESARLQALQVKQQLGVQALAIANQAPQSILALFR
ncbi:MAG: flagellin [Parvularculaceae bacterium]